MIRPGIIFLVFVLAWLTGTTPAVASGHADIHKVFSTSQHASDRGNFETWEAALQASRSPALTGPGDQAAPSDRSMLLAANAELPAADSTDEAWDDESETAGDDEWGDEEDWGDEWDEDGEEGLAEEIPDPLIAWNWQWYQFNDKFYLYLWEPLAQGYGYVVPETARKGVKNFFSNLFTPIRLVNCLLQGKWSDAGNETARFLINTTAGVLGFGDPALKDYGPPKDEDFGQTLGYWGLNDGFYLTWPFIGPSSLRDSIGFFVDGWLNPVAYFDGKPYKTTWWKVTIRAYEKFNATSFQIGEYEKLKGMALDPYVAIRNIYFQNRQKKIAE